MPSSRFTPTPDAWDIVLATDADDTDPLTLMLVQDADVALWEGVDAPSLATDQAVYREQAVMWKPFAGCGYSRRTPDATTTGADGQIVSTGTAFGKNATFAVPGVALPAGKLNAVALPAVFTAITTSVIRDAVDYGDYTYFTTETPYLLVIHKSDPDLDGYLNFGGTYETQNVQIFDSNLLICGEDTGPIYSYNPLSGIAAGGASCQALRMDRVNWQPSNQVMNGAGGGTSADHLILVSANGAGFYHVVSGNDPLNFANWISNAGSPIPVGDSNFPIQRLVVGGRTVWFAKTNGLHGFTETGRAVNLTPWMERAYNTFNARSVLFYSDAERAVVFYAHMYGLVAITVNGTLQESAEFVQFGGRLPNETPIYGRPRAMCAWVDGIFVAYYCPDQDGVNTSYVMRLIFEKDGSYRWSGSECTIQNEEITFLRVVSMSGAPRLYIATQDANGKAKLYWQSLPQSGNPWVDYLHGTGHKYATGWDVYLPREDGDSTAEKVVRRYDMVARGVGSGNSITAYASADEGAYEEQGTFSSGARSSFTAPSYQSGTAYEWKLSCVNTEDEPIALESFQARMSVLPEQADVWTFRCQLAAGQGIGNDAMDLQDPYTVRQRLRAFQRRGPIQMRRSPLSRETLIVKVEQGARIQTVKARKTGETIVVVTFTVSVLQSGALYGADSYSYSDYGSE